MEAQQKKMDIKMLMRKSIILKIKSKSFKKRRKSLISTIPLFKKQEIIHTPSQIFMEVTSTIKKLLKRKS